MRNFLLGIIFVFICVILYFAYCFQRDVKKDLQTLGSYTQILLEDYRERHPEKFAAPVEPKKEKPIGK